jgi:Raf kinase inhibitor-like YbhB/YbcL family protein
MDKKILLIMSVLFMGFAHHSFMHAQSHPMHSKKRKKSMIDDKSIIITSNAFKQGESIPLLYTCDGQDVSPALQWSSVPLKTKSFVLICDDPDAPMGRWVHWIVFNIPATVTHFEQGKAAGGMQATNSWGKKNYGGPCPPNGTHRYFFKLYALDTMLDLTSVADVSAVEKAMEGHVVGKGELMGTYKRVK